MKFTFKGFIKVFISMETENYIKFQISDSGIGIPEERKSQLLNFFSNAEKNYNIGLGLYVSKMILSFLGDYHITLKSTLGEGTEFSFILPIKDKNSLLNSSSALDMCIDENCIKKIIPRFDVHTIDPMNYDVLIVDDIEINRKILISILKEQHLKVLEANNGREAVQIVKDMDAQEKIIKVIIMDCNMPIMDGWQASKIIRDMEDSKEIKKSPIIIGYTAYSSSEDIDLCYESGMNIYLVKPSAPPEILETVKCCLENYNENSREFNIKIS